MKAYVEPEEITLMKKETTNLRDRLLIRLLFHLGCRVSEVLMGNSPGGSAQIDPTVGASQADIFHHYKLALMRATALDRSTRTEEKRARRERRATDPANIERLAERYLSRMPYKAQGCRYHSFVVYFSNLARLRWVEPTGREKASSFQDRYLLGQPRKYFRLTKAGMEASDAAWSNPHLTLYGRD